MALSVGIVGLPNTGKSTLFNTLTEKCVPAENFPFCTIDPSVGVVKVLDERLNKLANLSKSEKVIETAIEFVDIAGLVKGASSGEGLGNEFLTHIKETDAIAHTVRIFEDKDITHVEGNVSPLRDIEIINTELILKDIQIIENRLQKLAKDLKKNDKDALKESEILKKGLLVLNKGELLSNENKSEEEVKTFNNIGLITTKPMFFILNTKVFEESSVPSELKDYLTKTNSKWVLVDVLTEGELKGSTDAEKEMRKELNIEEDGIDRIIKTAYDLLNLITFFTTGEKESRAWAISKGSTAPRAGRAIHSDFEDKFIRAEVISYDDLIKFGSVQAAREGGSVRIEGKDYIVKDADVINFRI